MENLKFILFTIIILGGLGYAGYWAFNTIESGSTHVDVQKQLELKQKNEDLVKEVTGLKKEISLLESYKESQSPTKVKEEATTKIPEQVTPTPTTTPLKTTVLKNQTLINALQKLADGNIFLKVQSQGPAVGSIQKFLNLYNKTTNRIDNDYGESTATAIKSFQKIEGMTANGQVGTTSFKKMISWLKTH